MDNDLKLQFIEHLSRLEGKEYLSSVIAYKAAPTIKNYKPASLFVFNHGRKDHLSLWHRYEADICGDFKLQSFTLKERDESIVILLYRPKILERFVNNEPCQNFLGQFGYASAKTLEEKLLILKNRFNKSLPHEIGIFLGIPLADVEGFIKYKGKGSLLCREWKVYKNPQRAAIIFDKYDRARRNVVISVIKQSYTSLESA